MRVTRSVLSGYLASLLIGTAGPASAAVVLDPVKGRPLAGLTVAITPFLTIPASAAANPRARIQYVTPLRDGTGRLFVNDTRGILYQTNRAGAPAQSILDLRTAGLGYKDVGAEGGLLGVAFHPNFNGDRGKAGYGVLYLHYTATQASGTADYLAGDAASHHAVIREFTVTNPGADTLAIGASREVLRIGHAQANHNGGTIGFNPNTAEGTADYGKLYIGLGDRGGANDPGDVARDLSNPLGKILRIDPADPDGAGGLDYSVPSDNPFVGRAGALGEVWASGLRNPQQFSWDSTGRMFITDIGQGQIEEVNLGVKGADYGWSDREGTFAKPEDKGDFNVYDLPADDGALGFTYPIAQYDHDEGRSIGGGFLYEGSLLPELRGQYLLTDNPTGRIFYFSPEAAAGGGTAPLYELFLTLGGSPFTFLASEGYGSSPRVDLRFGIDDLGELYMLTKRDGDIFRFAPRIDAAVPEPATWAMLVAGFGLVGGALRTRARVRLSS